MEYPIAKLWNILHIDFGISLLSLRTDLAFAIAAEEDAVIDVFVGLGNPHRELAGRDGSLTVQHAGMEGEMTILAKYQFQSRVDTFLRLFIQIFISK